MAVNSLVPLSLDGAGRVAVQIFFYLAGPVLVIALVKTFGSITTTMMGKGMAKKANTKARRTVSRIRQGDAGPVGPDEQASLRQLVGTPPAPAQDGSTEQVISKDDDMEVAVQPETAPPPDNPRGVEELEEMGFDARRADDAYTLKEKASYVGTGAKERINEVDETYGVSNRVQSVIDEIGTEVEATKRGGIEQLNDVTGGKLEESALIDRGTGLGQGLKTGGAFIGKTVPSLAYRGTKAYYQIFTAPTAGSSIAEMTRIARESDIAAPQSDSTDTQIDDHTTLEAPPEDVISSGEDDDESVSRDDDTTDTAEATKARSRAGGPSPNQFKTDPGNWEQDTESTSMHPETIKRRPREFDGSLVDMQNVSFRPHGSPEYDDNGIIHEDDGSLRQVGYLTVGDPESGGGTIKYQAPGVDREDRELLTEGQYDIDKLTVVNPRDPKAEPFVSPTEVTSINSRDASR